MDAITTMSPMAVSSNRVTLRPVRSNSRAPQAGKGTGNKAALLDKKGTLTNHRKGVASTRTTRGHERAVVDNSKPNSVSRMA